MEKKNLTIANAGAVNNDKTIDFRAGVIRLIFQLEDLQGHT